jgi:phosphatidylserine/phosphatidylglycerophosphate/cardiolipin synthase-like enzyme
MFTPVQRGIAIGLLFSSFVCLAAFGTSTAVLTPLIDRPGTSAYCDAVAAAMEDASSSIDLLLSSADVTGVPLWDSVIAASDRGVSVRVLLDASDWAPDITADNQRVVSYLTGHGIECRFDDPGVTTHAKMAVLDRTVVVLGSSNWNKYAFLEHEQTNVMIEDAEVGGAFSEYFDRLWEARLPVDGVEIDFDAALSDEPAIVPLPDGPETALYAALLLKLLPRARRSVHVAMYRVSVYPNYPGSLANELVDGLISAARRGLDVRILIDDCRYYADSADANLASAITLYQQGIEVRFDGPEETTHVKLVVIDGESVVLGSTNWNYYSLEQNVEANVGLLRIPQVAEAFEAYFEILWEDGRPITP